MGNKLVEAFTPQIAKIKTEYIKKAVIAILEKCNDQNAIEAASSSGKYHPTSDLGTGGLIRHSIIVASLAEIMMRCRPEYDDIESHDRVYAACLLHDMQKFDGVATHSWNDHPVRMQNLITDYADKVEDVGERRSLIQMAEDVGSHMSRWNEAKDYATGKVTVMPLPQTDEQYIIVYADLISANKELPELMESFKNEALARLKEQESK